MFRFATEKDYEKIIDLFHSCFGDPISEIRTFLSFFSSQKNFYIGICEKEKKIVSMACLIPAKFQEKSAFYVYGVCTHPNYRHRRLSTKLMDFLKKQAEAKEASCLFLVPANKKLESFYQRQGYSCFSEIPSSCIDASVICPPVGSCREITVPEYLTLRESFARENYVFSFSREISEFALKQRDSHVLLLEISHPQLSAPLGAIIYPQKKEATLLEITSWDREEQILSLNVLFHLLSEKSHSEKISFCPGNPLCIYPLQEMTLSDNPYFAFPMDNLL